MKDASQQEMLGLVTELLSRVRTERLYICEMPPTADDPDPDCKPYVEINYPPCEFLRCNPVTSTEDMISINRHLLQGINLPSTTSAAFFRQYDEDGKCLCQSPIEIKVRQGF